jgi:excisionase family DNA binding protein
VFADSIEQFDHALSASELAQLLSVHRLTIYRAAKSGALRSFRINSCIRFSPRAVAAWLRERGARRSAVSVTKPNSKRSLRSTAKAGARSAKSATTRLAGDATSGSAAKSSNSSDTSMTAFAGAVESSRQLFSTTSTGTRINIRGALCSNCNRGLGLLGDTLEGAMKAVEYLRRYESRKTTTKF